MSYREDHKDNPCNICQAPPGVRCEHDEIESLPSVTQSRLPMQPLYKDKHGTVRFQENKIVRYLLDNGGLDLNRLSAECYSYPSHDWEQFFQLIGYSLSGYHELEGVSNKAATAASKAAHDAGFGEAIGCRDQPGGCPIHGGGK